MYGVLMYTKRNRRIKNDGVWERKVLRNIRVYKAYVDFHVNEQKNLRWT